MKILYILLILCLVHCSNNLRFDQQLPSDRFPDILTSEQEDFVCEKEEGCVVTETFLMDGSETAVDIVFVLDVSPSMKDNLKKLGSSMLDLLTYIQDFDWQMAFTTADHGDHKKMGEEIGHERWENYQGNQPHFGRFMQLEHRGHLLSDKILNNRNRSYDIIFYDTLTINSDNTCYLPPFCQKAHEQPLRSLKAAIERDENRNFFRTNADLIAIIITNEDERIEDRENATTAVEVNQAFRAQFPNEKNLYGFGILIQDRSCYQSQKRQSSKATYGNTVAELAQETHGVNISICSEDYGEAIKDISRIIRSRVLDNVYLTTAFPKSGSVNVEITPKQNIRWEVEGRHIVFRPALRLGSKVQVTYTAATDSVRF